MFFLLHECIRNDGCEEHTLAVTQHNTQEAAIDAAVAVLGVVHDWLNDEYRQRAKTMLADGIRIFVWEWQRKGNRDFVQVAEGAKSFEVDLMRGQNLEPDGDDSGD